MTKLKLTPAFIKKFHKFDEEGRRLVDVWTKRHSSKKDFTYDEEKFYVGISFIGKIYESSTRQT